MKRRRSEDDDQPEPPQATHSSPSPASSPREGDIAETEGEHTHAPPEADPSQSSLRSGDGEPSSSTAPPPPKKKRTRTLTTPHQAAVLHALLAQSRFPTTAMREEVGRAIGLSARKVQVWFQNQRQKARRPGTRTHEGQGARSDLVRHASGPYGVHIPGTVQPPSQGSSSAPPVAGPSTYGGSAYLAPMSTTPSSSGPYFESAYAAPRQGVTQLTGPGVPGPAASYHPYTPTAESLDRLPPAPRYTLPIPEYPPHPLPATYSSPEPWPSAEGRPPSPEPFVYAPHRELSRNLPPLALDEPRHPPRLPPLEPIPPLRHWSQLDAPPISPAAYSSVSVHSTPRPRSPPITLPRPPTRSGLPRLHIPPTPQTRLPHDRTLPPLPFPPATSSLLASRPGSSYHEGERSPRSAHPSLPPLSAHHERRSSPGSWRGSQSPPEASREPQLSPLSTRGTQISPLALRGLPPPGGLPSEAHSSPAQSPSVSRAARFDPVRAAISDNESQGSTPPAEPHAP